MSDENETEKQQMSNGASPKKQQANDQSQNIEVRKSLGVPPYVKGIIIVVIVVGIIVALIIFGSAENTEASTSVSQTGSSDQSTLPTIANCDSAKFANILMDRIKDKQTMVLHSTDFRVVALRYPEVVVYEAYVMNLNTLKYKTSRKTVKILNVTVESGPEDIIDIQVTNVSVNMSAYGIDERITMLNFTIQQPIFAFFIEFDRIKNQLFMTDTEFIWSKNRSAITDSVLGTNYVRLGVNHSTFGNGKNFIQAIATDLGSFAMQLPSIDISTWKNDPCFPEMQ